MENLSSNNQVPRHNNQIISKSKYSNPKIVYWLLGIGICLVIGVWSLVILLGGCGDIASEISSLSISPSTAKVGVNQILLFSAIAKNSAGMIVQVSPAWSFQGNIGSISPSGLFTAGTVDATGKVSATVNLMTAEAAVTVTAKGWVEGRVKDEIEKYVAGIKVYLLGTSLQDITDTDGLYSISDVPAGAYQVWTDDPRGIYKPSSVEATVGSGETVRKNIVIYYYTRPPDTTPPTL
jgi:hypothetical protein